MQHHEATFTGAGGLPLYYQSWHPITQTKAVLGIVHGLGSHSGLFSNIVQALVPQGYAVYGYDLRGHGRSPGQRGYINRWLEFRQDLDQFWKLMVSQHQELPCFVLGHSLGAIITLDYALYYPQNLSGIITMAPALDPVGVSPVKLKIGRILSRTVPRFTLNTGIPQNAGSHDAGVISAYANDPLRHRKGTARLVTEFLQATRWIESHLNVLQIPVLILHGTEDPVALPAGSRRLFEQIQLMDKEHREYPGAFHDLHNEMNAHTVSRDIANWLTRQVNRENYFCQLGLIQENALPAD
jgi:alpha-beta hydrolase superfamily lysophospholipase